MISDKNPRGAGRKKMDDADKKHRVQITLSPDVYRALNEIDMPTSKIIDKALRVLLKL